MYLLQGGDRLENRNEINEQMRRTECDGTSHVTDAGIRHLAERRDIHTDEFKSRGGKIVVQRPVRSPELNKNL